MIHAFNIIKAADILLKAEADEREEEAMTFRDIVTRNENAFKKMLISIFKAQKKEVKGKLESMKDITDLFMFDTTVWKINTRLKAEKACKKALNENGKRIYSDLENMEKSCKFVLVSTTYDMDYPEALAYLEEQGIKLADDVTEETERILAEVIAQAFSEGLALTEISALIDESFDDSYRATMIARTEIVRAANYGALSAYKQSGVVESKEWLTAQDEKVCPFCGSLDRTVLGLDDSFLAVGGTLEVTTDDGKVHTLTNNYLDTQAPPVHPHCRCTLLPVIKDI